MSCSINHRHGLDPMLLWLWRRLAAAAPIPPLAWDPPYAEGATLKKQKKKKMTVVCDLSSCISGQSEGSLRRAPGLPLGVHS